MLDNSTSPLIRVLRLFAAVFVIFIPIVWISLPFTNFTGDLTRVGKLAERDFSWTKKQVEILAKDTSSSAIAEADVLVVGDSFSAGLFWQTALVRNALKVATIHWSEVGGICSDFADQIYRAGFRGRYLIIESVERGAEERLSRSSSCQNGSVLVKNSAYQGGGSSGLPTLSYSLNLSGKFLVGFNTLVNSIALRTDQNYLNFYNEIEKGVHIYPVSAGCKYFSNHLCHLGIFYYEDYEREILGQKSIDHLRQIHKNLKDKNPALNITWAIVPNKSSIYHREISSDFWEKLAKENLGPNLYQVMMDGRDVVKDLYDPNGSHFSNDGYQLMGDSIFTWMNR